MKAIRTTYLGPTDFKGSRITARADDGKRVTLGWDAALDSEGNHRKAAYALRDRMGWTGELIGGSFGRYTFWVFVS